MSNHIPKTACLWLLAGLLLSACASQIPPLIRKAPPDNPSLTGVRAHASDYRGRQLRWGGKIIETENRESTTWLSILERPLYRDGEPEYSDESGGRFIAIVPEFLDPKVYTPDRLVTITGTLLRTEARKVGEFPYTYPVVEAQAWYLWPVETELPYGYPGPWWYDPWYYGPWYYEPWYPYGYPYRYWR
jgi:outer membrane lipoprotein